MNKTDFENNYFQYLLFDDPIPYKDLLIYPCRMKNYLEFKLFSQGLSIDKNNTVKDNPEKMIKIIKMSYLDYLIYLYQKSDGKDSNLSFAISTLNLCLQANVTIWSNPEHPDKDNQIKVSLGQRDIFLGKNDFDNIRKIICYQNLINLDEDDLTPSALKAQLKEAQLFNARNRDKMGDIEDQVICLSISTGLSCDEIKNLSIRKFSKALGRIDYKLHYEIRKEAEFAGFVKFDKPIAHWMCDLDHQDQYKDVKLSVEEFQKQSGLTINESISDKSEDSK